MGTRYCVTGWFRDGVLRGVGEVAIDDRVAEAAVSVEAPWRNLGVGRGLMRRALRRAWQAGCGVVTVLTACDNAPKIRLAKDFGAQLSFVDGDVIGELTPGRVGPAELVGGSRSGISRMRWLSTRRGPGRCWRALPEPGSLTCRALRRPCVRASTSQIGAGRSPPIPKAQANQQAHPHARTRRHPAWQTSS